MRRKEGRVNMGNNVKGVACLQTMTDRQTDTERQTEPSLMVLDLMLTSRSVGVCLSRVADCTASKATTHTVHSHWANSRVGTFLPLDLEVCLSESVTGGREGDFLPMLFLCLSLSLPDTDMHTYTDKDIMSSSSRAILSSDTIWGTILIFLRARVTGLNAIAPSTPTGSLRHEVTTARRVPSMLCRERSTSRENSTAYVSLSLASWGHASKVEPLNMGSMRTSSRHLKSTEEFMRSCHRANQARDALGAPSASHASEQMMMFSPVDFG